MSGKPVIGLLGAPGSGKSLVADQFRQLGCAVIDADQLARDALQTPAVRDQLVAWWGQQVLDAEGRIDRKAVGRIVFDNPDELRRLESVTHPEVARQRRTLHARYEADPQVVAIVEDSPLLLEKRVDADCDVLVLVEAPREVRLRRLQEHRGWSEAELDRREKNQWPLDSKRKRADYIVNNHAEAADTFAQTRRVLSQILQRPSQSPNQADSADPAT
ncbi:MAG: dephospho-CoA kinase [Phycisphaeraceae bacterium]